MGQRVSYDLKNGSVPGKFVNRDPNPQKDSSRRWGFRRW